MGRVCRFIRNHPEVSSVLAASAALVILLNLQQLRLSTQGYSETLALLVGGRAERASAVFQQSRACSRVERWCYPRESFGPWRITTTRPFPEPRRTPGFLGSRAVSAGGLSKGCVRRRGLVVMPGPTSGSQSDIQLAIRWGSLHREIPGTRFSKMSRSIEMGLPSTSMSPRTEIASECWNQPGPGRESILRGLWTWFRRVPR